MHSDSSVFAAASYLDPAERIAGLRRAARRASEDAREIRRVVLFGSLVTGTPTPRSDADLLIEVTSSPHSTPRDRIPAMLASFQPLPCPLDLFILTSEELECWRCGSPLIRVALETGVDLL